MDAARELAAGLHALPFEQLPSTTVQAVKRLFIDIAGIAFAGSDAAGVVELRDVLQAQYGSGRVGVWASRAGLPAAEAALLNCTMAHALDFDDTHDLACLHAGASVIPAALAIAEDRGGVDGRDFIAAVAAGVDTICRMGLASTIPPNASGWMYTALYAYFGATTAASRLLRLDLDRTVHALGIAYGQAAGNTQCMPDGALSKRIQPGFGARAGVLSALLAERGVSGVRNVFEGGAGLYNTYLKGHFDRSRLLAGLGRQFEVDNLSYKPYPCCRHNHTAIDAVLGLRAAHAIDPAQVESIDIGVNGEALRNVCQPFGIKARPRSVVDAQFSIPFCVATALVRGEVFVADLAEARLGDPQILALAARVSCRLDEALERQFGRQVSPAVVEIRLRDGRRLAVTHLHAPGSPDLPMSEAAMLGKYRRCAATVAATLGEDRIARLPACIQDLESLADMRELAALLVP